MGRDAKLPHTEHNTPHTPMRSPPQKLTTTVLSGVYGGFITEGWLVKSLAIDSASSPFLLPRNQVGLRVAAL